MVGLIVGIFIASIAYGILCIFAADGFKLRDGCQCGSCPVPKGDD